MLFLPSDQRRKILREYGRRYDLNIFIETGTNLGDTPLFLRDEFREIWTIELSPHLHKTASERLSPYTHITCLQGDSTTVLPMVLNEISSPALVWLDGHYSGGDTARGKIDTPVKEELQILFNDGRPHVILVDDARLFGGGPEHTEEFADYPSLEWVEGIGKSYGYKYELRDDIIRLTP